MGENKEIKLRLSTVVYLFIIIVLVVALGVVYYLGFVKEDKVNNMIANGDVKYEIEVEMSELENINYSDKSQLKILEDKYKGKTVKITGYVSNFGDDDLEPGRTYINIGNRTTYENRIYAGGITSDNDVKGQINKLEKGQKISIVGVAFKAGTPEESSWPMILNDIKIIEEKTETNNTEKEEMNENKLKEGIYSFANNDRKDAIAENNKYTPILLETYIKFENNDFKAYDNGQIFTSGKYEKIGDNLIKCVISDERSFEIKIMGNNELEITKLNSNDAETEFNIRLYDILGEENEYVLYEETDLVGTWSTKYVYKDMGGGDFWKTEEHQIDETFTFNNDGTYKVKEYRAVAEGTYELEKNQIHISHDKSEGSKMYLIDKDTILYTLGTEYKIILSKNS